MNSDMDFRQAELWSQPGQPDHDGTGQNQNQIPGTFPDETSWDHGNDPVEYFELEGPTLPELDDNVRKGDSQETKPSINSTLRKKPNPKRTTASPRPKPSVKPGNDIVIAVFGLTGTGKSSFISKLTGRQMKIGHGLKSCTSEIEEVRWDTTTCNVTLVDTPGFDDTTRSDTEVLRLIASWMKDAYDDRTNLTGIVYFHRITDQRMSGSSTKNVRMLRSLCGTQNLSHVILATTMWDNVSEEDGNARERELLTEGMFWGDLKRDGSLVRRYDYTQEGARTLVNELLQMSPIILQIQQELAVEKKKLIDTDAGQEVDRALAKLKEQHLANLAEVRQELTQAMEENNSKLQKELEVEREMLKQKLLEVEESKKALKAPINRKAWYHLNWRCKKCHARLTVERHYSTDRKGKCPGCGFEQVFI